GCRRRFGVCRRFPRAVPYLEVVAVPLCPEAILRFRNRKIGIVLPRYSPEFCEADPRGTAVPAYPAWLRFPNNQTTGSCFLGYPNYTSRGINANDLVIHELVFAIDLNVIEPWLGKTALFNLVPAVNRAGTVFKFQTSIPFSRDRIPLYRLDIFSPPSQFPKSIPPPDEHANATQDIGKPGFLGDTNCVPQVQ